MRRDDELTRGQAVKIFREYTGVANASNDVLIRFFQKTSNGTFVKRYTREYIQKIAKDSDLLEKAREYKNANNKIKKQEIKFYTLGVIDTLLAK